MAIRFDAAGDYLSRTASAPGSTRSVSFWLYLTNDRNAYGSLFIIVDAGGTNFDMVYLTSDGTTLGISASGNAVSGTSLSTGTWYHIVYTRTGTTRRLYLDGVLDITNTNANTFTASQFYIGSDSVGYLDGRMDDLKIWEAELTADEAGMEGQALRPVRFENLWAWYPMWPGAGERNKDYSGNGRDLTDNAGVTDEDRPPVSYGNAGYVFPYVSTATPTLEQEGFRWRNDDGSESVATWRQSQDVDDTVAADTNVRLRVLVNATGDVASKKFKLQYRKVGNSVWRRVQ